MRCHIFVFLISEPAKDLVAESLMTMAEIEQSLASQEEVERDDNAGKALLF